MGNSKIDTKEAFKSHSLGLRALLKTDVHRENYELKFIRTKLMEGF